MKLLSTKILLGIGLTTLMSLTTASDLPVGWFKAGSHPNQYVMKADNTTVYSGKNSVIIQSINEKMKGFGTVMQSTSAKEYLGKHIVMRGMVKSKNVKKWAGLWLRIDGENRKVLGFDNMRRRAIKGNTEWTEYEIKMYVPLDAKSLKFGALLKGTGTIWFDNITFDSTTIKEYTPDLKQPSNLDFEIY